MTAIHKLLLLVVVALAAALFVRWLMRPNPPPPLVDLTQVSAPMARDLQTLLDSLNPKKADDWEHVGKSLRATGFFPQADYCYAQLNQMSPSNARYLFDWAGIQARMGRLRESTATYQQALDLGFPKPELCHLGIGQNKLRVNDVAGAIESLEKAGDLPRAQYLLCRALTRNGRAADAQVRLDALLRQDPAQLQFVQQMSWTLNALNQPQDAQTFRERSSRAHFDHFPDLAHDEDDHLRQFLGEEAIINAANERAAKGEIAPALEMTRQLLDEAYSQRAALAAAQFAFRLGQFQESKQILEECQRRFGSNVELLQHLGDAYAGTGDETRAQAAWLKAVRILDGPDLRSSLAASYRRTGNTAEAARQEGYAISAKGKRLWRKNALAEAKSALTRATEIVADHAPTWYYLADTLRALGEKDAARAAYTRCLELQPEHGRAILGLSRLNESP